MYSSQRSQLILSSRLYNAMNHKYDVLSVLKDNYSSQESHT